MSMVQTQTTNQGVPMRQRRIQPVLMACLSFFTVSGWAATFGYDNFTSPAGLILQGDAAAFQERVRLTPAAVGQAGGLWYGARVNVKNGFQTTFQFQITESTGADGLAFV